jgi:hypothetical protein
LVQGAGHFTATSDIFWKNIHAGAKGDIFQKKSCCSNERYFLVKNHPETTGDIF